MDTKREYRRRHYEANRSLYLAKNIAYQNIFKAIIARLKSRPCADCGGTFPACAMDFDHVSGEKVITIAALLRYCSPSRLLSEIAKCELVCANCHRIRHEKRRESKTQMSIADVVAAIAVRKKFYDRKSWIEIFKLIGEEFPPEPIKPQRGSRCVRKVGPEGTAWCGTHKDFIPVGRFEKNSSRWNGLQRQCMDCRKKMPSRRSRKAGVVQWQNI